MVTPKFIAKYSIFYLMRKGIIAGIIIAIAIGIAAASVYSSNLNENEIEQSSQELEIIDSEEPEAVPQQEGRQLSIELSEQVSIKSP